VVAGDADQQLDAAVSFPGWDAAMRALRRQDHERVVLDVGYRCPPEVSALARSVLGRSPPPEATTVERFPTASALHAWLGATAERLLDQDPRARVGVFTREGRAARRVADGIRAHVPARLVWGGDFGFAPGVDVTTIDQVRGLEFDHVLVADASAAVYADDERSRRALYVAITRARRTVRLAAVGSPTPLVSPR
jgi:DNA helicase IV